HRARRGEAQIYRPAAHEGAARGAGANSAAVTVTSSWPASLPALASREHRLALFHERAHAFGVVGGEARLALELAFKFQLSFKIIVPGRVERALDQGKPERRRGGELGAELVRLLHQRAVVDRLPDHPPGLRLLGRYGLGGERKRAGAGGADQARQDPGATGIGH